MAILGDLLVQGRSRFLQQIYATDLNVSGATTFSSLSISGNATIGGTLGVTGKTTFSGSVDIAGTLMLTRTADAESDSNNSPALIVGPISSSHLEFDQNEILAKSGTTGKSPLYLNNNGGDIYLSYSGYTTTVRGYFTASGKTTLNDTHINTTLIVEDEIRTPKFIVDNIANLGGEFVVAPTVVCTNPTVTVSGGPTSSNANNPYTLTVTDSSMVINQSDANSPFAGIQWTSGSIVKVAGTIGNTVLVDVTGTMTSNLNTTTGTITFTVPASVGTLASASGSQVKNLHIMIYRVGSSTGAHVGIFMTSYGESHYPYIEIYNGSLTAPTTRLGYLNGISGFTLPNGSTVTPSGWGLYTNNGYFNGTIYSTYGMIGGFNIGSAAIYNGTNAIDSTATGVYLGIDGIRNYKDANTYVNIQEGVITAKGVNLSGSISATSGSIAGWTINSNYLASGSASAPAANVLLLSPSGTSNSYEVAGKTSSGWMITAGTTFGVNKDGGIYATKGKIGKFTISSTSLYTGSGSTQAGMGADDYAFWAGSSTLSSAPFRVSYAGALTSTSGQIGKYTITSTSLYTGTGTSQAGMGDGTYAFWAGNSTVASAPFRVTYAGALTSTSGSIGGFNISSTAIYTGSKSTFSNTSTGVYFGTDGIRLGNTFRVSSDGTLYANGANITSIDGTNITAGTISANQLNVTDINASGKLSFGSIDNLLADVNNTSTTKTYGTNNRYFSDSNANRTGECITISDPPEPWIKTGSRITCTGAQTVNNVKSALVHYGFANSVFVEEGRTYTLSFWARCTEGTCAYYSQVGSSPYMQKNSSNVYQEENALTSKWQQIVYTFKYEARTCGAASSFRVYPGVVFKANTAGVGEVCGVRLQLGYHPTTIVESVESVQKTTQWLEFDSNIGLIMGESTSSANAILKASELDFNYGNTTRMAIGLNGVNTERIVMRTNDTQTCVAWVWDETAGALFLKRVVV